MNSIFLAVFSLAFVMLQINTVLSINETAKLSRRKRYVAFPEGATLSIAICMTIQTIIYRNDEIFTEGLNWGVSYDLPNNTGIQEFLHPKQAIKRRHRRDLYQKMELIMDSMGYQGRNCVKRALCESGRYLTENKNSVIEEILKIVFGFPHQKLLINEPEEHFEYHKAHQAGKKAKQKECFEMFPGCSFSLLDLALGYYSADNQIM